MWRCPACKSSDHLEVVVELWAKLVQSKSEPEAFQTVLEDASEHHHEWTENSTMRCVNPACPESNDTYMALRFEEEAAE